VLGTDVGVREPLDMPDLTASDVHSTLVKLGAATSSGPAP
jgi:hypothetical protein